MWEIEASPGKTGGKAQRKVTAGGAQRAGLRPSQPASPGLPDPAAPSLTCLAGLTWLRFLITFLPLPTSNAPQFSISGYKVSTSPDKTGRDKGLHSSQISRHQGPGDRTCWSLSCLTWGRSLEFAKTHLFYQSDSNKALRYIFTCFLQWRVGTEVVTTLNKRDTWQDTWQRFSPGSWGSHQGGGAHSLAPVCSRQPVVSKLIFPTAPYFSEASR